MNIITHQDIISLNISPLDCYKWVEQMIARKADSILPPKISMKPLDGAFCNVMPSIVVSDDGSKVGGVKLVTRYPNRIPSLDSKLFLFNADNGKFKALMDANWITAMRTGAVAVHSIDLLAKKDFKTIAIIGLGNTARATISVLAEKFRNRRFTLRLLKYKGQEQLFAERFKQFDCFIIEYYENIDNMFRGSDVIISAATYLPNDICSDDAFDEGVLLVPIHTLGYTNCDLFFDKVFADDTDHVKHFKNFAKFKRFAEVHNVVAGKAQGRENDRERILVYNIGIAMHDIFFADKIYNLFDESKLKKIDFAEPCDKFWI